MKKATISIILVTMLVKVTGFLRDIVLTYSYGASSVSDAYIISLTIPASIFAFISVGITTGFIPIYTSIEKNFNLNKGIYFTNNLLNFLLLFSSVVIFLVFIYVDNIVKMFASGFDDHTFYLAVKFTKITLFGIYASVVMAIYRGFLQVKGNFLITSLVALPNNLIILISIYLSYKLENLYILSYGTLLGLISQFLILVPNMLKEKYSFRIILDLKDYDLRKMLIVAIPVILGTSVNEINMLIDRTVASGLNEGAISALDYSFRLAQIINSLFAASIAIAMYPIISKMVVNNNFNLFNKITTNALNSITVVVIPISLLIMYYSKDIISILYGRGAFNQSAIHLTSISLFYYTIGIIGYGYREVLTRVFYAIDDSWSPVFTSILSVLLNIVLILILSEKMGVAGLALATSGSAILGAILLMVHLKIKKKNLHLNYQHIVSTMLKTLVASLIMIVSTWSINEFLIFNVSALPRVIVGGTISLLIYYIMATIFKISEFLDLTMKIKQKLRLTKL